MQDDELKRDGIEIRVSDRNVSGAELNNRSGFTYYTKK